MKPEIGALLSGYAANTLTPDEEARLIQAAFDDQEVFDALAAEQSLREVLAEPSARRELLAALERPTLLQRITAWAIRPWPAIAAATAAAILGLLWLRAPSGPAIPTPGATEGPGWTGPSPPPSDWATVGRPEGAPTRAVIVERLLALPARGGPEVAGLRIDRLGDVPVYRAGERMRISFSVEREANVLLLLKRSDGSIAQLFPNAATAFPRAKPGFSYSASFDPDGAVPVSGPPGEHLIRLVAFPVGTDPLEMSLEQLRLVTPRLGVVDRAYRVAP